MLRQHIISPIPIRYPTYLTRFPAPPLTALTKRVLIQAMAFYWLLIQFNMLSIIHTMEVAIGEY